MSKGMKFLTWAAKPGIAYDTEGVTEATSREEAEAAALRSYEAHLGKVIRVGWLMHYVDSEPQELHVPGGFLVRVCSTRREDILRWMDDEYLDPYWDVEAVDDLPGPPDDGGSPWIYAKTFKVHKPR